MPDDGNSTDTVTFHFFPSRICTEFPGLATGEDVTDLPVAISLLNGIRTFEKVRPGVIFQFHDLILQKEFETVGEIVEEFPDENAQVAVLGELLLMHATPLPAMHSLYDLPISEKKKIRLAISRLEDSIRFEAVKGRNLFLEHRPTSKSRKIKQYKDFIRLARQLKYTEYEHQAQQDLAVLLEDETRVAVELDHFQTAQVAVLLDRCTKEVRDGLRANYRFTLEPDPGRPPFHYRRALLHRLHRIIAPFFHREKQRLAIVASIYNVHFSQFQLPQLTPKDVENSIHSPT